MKFRAFEFEDQSWFPGFIRDSMTDYLQFLFRTIRLYNRLYSQDEMLQIAHEIDNRQYSWIAGKVRNKFGMSIAYLTGYPMVNYLLKFR